MTPTYQPLATEDSPTASTDNLPKQQQQTRLRKHLRSFLVVLGLLFVVFASYKTGQWSIGVNLPTSVPEVQAPQLTAQPSKPQPSQPVDMPHTKGKYSVG